MSLEKLFTWDNIIGQSKEFQHMYGDIEDIDYRIRYEKTHSGELDILRYNPIGNDGENFASAMVSYFICGMPVKLNTDEILHYTTRFYDKHKEHIDDHVRDLLMSGK